MKGSQLNLIWGQRTHQDGKKKKISFKHRPIRPDFRGQKRQSGRYSGLMSGKWRDSKEEKKKGGRQGFSLRAIDKSHVYGLKQGGGGGEGTGVFKEKGIR